MSEARIAVLPDRGVVSVAGDDAETLLQGLVTNDLTPLRTAGASAVHAALLSPQGKILCDFLVAYDMRRAPVVRDGKAHAFLLDVPRDRTGDLIKRLTLYRLRARATIEDASASLGVMAQFGGTQESMYAHEPDLAALVLDPRDDALGARLIVPAGRAPLVPGHHPSTPGLPPLPRPVGAADFHAHRISLGIPEGGKDYDFGDAFPHEANLDLLHGVSFGKGCYVGQEIVARMEHRGTVRKRVVRVTGAADLPASRPDVTIGDVVIGRLGSIAGRQGLALLRLDRVIEAIDKGKAVTAAGVTLEVDAEMIARQRKLMAEKAAP